MRGLSFFICLAISLGVLGCGNNPGPKTDVSHTVPLSLEEWKTLPVEKKYEPETFERLKQGDPKIRSEKGWDRFMRTVIVPHRKKDIPGP